MRNLTQLYDSQLAERSTAGKLLLALDEVSMNILITGGAGFIGSHLSDYLVAQGHRVVVIDDLSTGSMDNLRKRGRAGSSTITSTPSSTGSS